MAKPRTFKEEWNDWRKRLAKAAPKRFDHYSLDRDLDLNAADIAVLAALNRYKYLTSRFLFEFAPGESQQWFRRRLWKLRRVGGYIFCPEGQRWHDQAKYRDLAYQLTARGRKALSSRGYTLNSFSYTGSEFFHDLAADLAVASVELACRNSENLRFITPEEILAGAKEQFEHPFTYEVTLNFGKKAKTVEVSGDYEPFGIEIALPDRKTRKLYIVGFEMDNATEDLRGMEGQRASIEKKLRAYDKLDSLSRFSKRFGLPPENTFVLFVTVAQHRAGNIVQLAQDVTGSPELFLVHTIPNFAEERSVTPRYELVTRPCMRGGGSAFLLSTGEEVQCGDERTPHPHQFADAEA